MDKETLELIAKLARKKNALRQKLDERGVLKKEGKNAFDKYKYFTESQYKQLFTELFSQVGLELSVSEISYDTFTGTDKQANGRMVKLCFKLTDIDTGFSEESAITGEGIDKGDKAGYKAYTGALKYYLATTFMVATGDEAEQDSISATMNTKEERKATESQLKILSHHYTTPDALQKVLDYFHVEYITDLTISQASAVISKIKETQA